MAKNPNLALGRLMGRLSALRQTLRKDERDLLDGLVLGATADEVVAHRMISQAADQASRKAVTAVAKRVNAGAQPEVVAHRMISQAADQASRKAATAVAKRVNTGAQPEVVAHGMVSQAVNLGARAAAKAVSARLDWDADKKSYRVNGD